MDEQHHQTLRVAQQEPGQQEEGQMESVLFVDPEISMHEQMEQVLQNLFALRHATTAAEALEALNRQRPHLIVSEVVLPDGSGLALCEQVRANPRTAEIPVLLLTTRAEIGDKVAGFMAGADDYVVKPLDPRFFGARIRLLLRLKNLDHQPLPGNASLSPLAERFKTE